MKLIGSMRSPFVRRVAITLNVQGMPFEHLDVPVFDQPEEVGKYNPLTRVPTLVLDDGEVLIESYAMIDAIDDMVGPEKALMPAHGKERRHVMRIVAAATGTMDKAQWAAYETRFHPKEKVHQPWIDHNDKSVEGGLAYLDGLAKEAGGDGFLAGGGALSQADISGVVAYTFAGLARPKLGIAGKYPNIAAFAGRLEATAPFKAAALPG
ncbi:MAG: glutathione S-transferase family protein [Rickettsiales bacterium]